METGNKAAFARPWSKIKQSPDTSEQVSVAQSGMTLREYYAGKAMEAMIANPKIKRPSDANNLEKELKEFSSIAVEYADSLLSALANEANGANKDTLHKT